nr:glutamic acid-rich protein-like [Tanacetum cinerariifolium]
GVVCLPNEEIFAGLAQMGYEKPSTKLTFYKAFYSSQWKFLIHTILQSLSAKGTSWNEFSTSMASAVICLSKGQRLNFSRYIFDSLVPAQDDVDQENVTEEIADDVAQPTSPLPPSPIIPPSPPHQSPRISPLQAAEGLKSANTAQQLDILKLKARVKKLERLNKVKSSKLRRLKKVGTS